MPAHEQVPVLLIDTADAHLCGSMRRYGDLVEQVLQSHAVPVRRLNLPASMPTLKFIEQSPSLQQWFRHALYCLILKRLVKSALKALANCGSRPAIIHILDGSYGYLVRWLPKDLQVMVTVHDLIPWLLMHGKTEKFVGAPAPSVPARSIIRATLKGWTQADHLLCVSESTEQDLRRLLPDSSRSVLWQPLSDFWLQPSPNTEPRQSMVLHVGNNGYYKNRQAVLDVFAKLENVDKLLMVGPPATVTMTERAARPDLRGRVEFLDVAHDLQLRQLYRQAKVFLFPSHYEGFGWPLLEAMAQGCPVVCGNAASLPEVVANAAICCNSSDVDSLAAAAQKLIDQPEYAAQQVQRGLARAAGFSVPVFSEGLLNQYHRLAAAVSVAKKINVE